MLSHKWKQKKLKPLYKFKGRSDDSVYVEHDGDGESDEIKSDFIQYTDDYGLNPDTATVLRVVYGIDIGCSTDKIYDNDSIKIRCGGVGKFGDNDEDSNKEKEDAESDYRIHTLKRLPDAIVERNDQDDDSFVPSPDNHEEDDDSFVPSSDNHDDNHEEDDHSFVPSSDNHEEDDDSFVPSPDNHEEDDDSFVPSSDNHEEDDSTDEDRKSCTMHFTKGSDYVDEACVGRLLPSLPEVELQETRKKLQKRITKALNREGLSRYLQSMLAGAMSMKNAKAVLVKVVRFLVWTYFQGYSRGHSSNAFTWFKNMIIHKYTKLGEYCTYLEKVKEFEPTTIKNDLGALSKCAKWAILFTKTADPKITQAHLAGFIEVITSFQKFYSKVNRKKRSYKTMESEVYLSKMPAGGLPQLQETFAAEITWLQSLVKLAHDYQRTQPGQPYYPMAATEYSRLTSAMYAALYAFAPNGRVSGIEDLKEVQYKQLVEEGHVHSSKFKTNSTYGYQPVILNKISYFFVKTYWDFFRPVAMINSDSTPQTPLQRSLWLTFDGKPERIGARVTQYFKRTLGMHITTTAIRSLVETTTEKLKKTGAISESQRDSVSNINGHSSQVTRDFYLMMDRNADVCSAREALDTIMPLSTQLNEMMNSSPTPANESIHRFESPPTWTGHTQDILRVADWGTGHPDYEKYTAKENTAVKRARWTQQELKYIADFCKKKLKANPEANSVIVKCCFQHIQRDPDALPIFHRNHVLDSCRLRTGYRTAIEKGLLDKEYI